MSNLFEYFPNLPGSNRIVAVILVAVAGHYLKTAEMLETKSQTDQQYDQSHFSTQITPLETPEY